MSGRKRMGALLVACSAAGAGLLVLLGQDSMGPEAMQRWLDELGRRPFTPWLLFAGVFLGGVIVFPVAPAVIFTGAVYGLAGGLPIALTGMFFACVTGYFIGKRLGADWAHKTPKAKRMSELIARHGALTSAVARWVPGVPFALQNLLLGAAEVRLAHFLVGSLIGASVVATIFVSTGAAGTEIILRLQGSLRYGWVAPAVGFVAGGWLLFKREAVKSKPEPSETALS